ncbi:hypothetical protein SRU_2120 [Salinibacter ruber DSM 13855]|uniref:DUF2085 domain-containing protein n=3 Tax=Salinibacter ruber TaxID=146919 RepID=Q2S0Q5_SALRD|nr:hypothetical protein SRU_2120 [Salinibacter ruber DSM 13855]
MGPILAWLEAMPTSPKCMANARSTRLVWYGLLAATSGVLILAMLPPILPAPLQAVVREGFAPVCHQLPGRSPHFGGVPVALCDRCSGIYVGLVVGVLGTGWGTNLWVVLGAYGRYVLLGALVPLGLDWGGPLLQLWGNGPTSRILTGLLFGSVAASYVTARLLHRKARASGTGGPE